MLPLYTHYLAPSDYGIWELLDLVMSLLGMVLNMGLTTAILKYYAAADSSEDRRGVISTGFVFALLTGSVVFTVGSALTPAATRALFGSGVSGEYLFLSCSLPVMAYIGHVHYTLIRPQNQAQRLVSLHT